MDFSMSSPALRKRRAPAPRPRAPTPRPRPLAPAPRPRPRAPAPRPRPRAPAQVPLTQAGYPSPARPAPAPKLTRAEFEAARKAGKPLFVRFGAPWCGHSKAMEPAWEEMRRAHPGVVADVDCTADAEFCRENEVRGYPTLALFRGDSKELYAGARTRQLMSTWLRARV